MRILVIAGTGFIGSHVTRQLAEAGHTVCVFHRGRTEANLPSDVHQVRLDSGANMLTSFPVDLLRFAPDSVIHMLAMNEIEAEAAMTTFRGHAGRFVAVSSGDVYLAYARFMSLERGSPEPTPLREDSPLRNTLYPYREQANSPDDMRYNYEKILVERAVMTDLDLPGAIVRLPKVFGPGRNADFATVHRFRQHPKWRWTHGYVENIAAAIALAAIHPKAIAEIFNVGEESTPTVEERLADLPPSSLASDESDFHDFRQDIVYDTRKIREQLGYSEIVPYKEAIRRTIESLAPT